MGIGHDSPWASIAEHAGCLPGSASSAVQDLPPFHWQTAPTRPPVRKTRMCLTHNAGSTTGRGNRGLPSGTRTAFTNLRKLYFWVFWSGGNFLYLPTTYLCMPRCIHKCHIVLHVACGMWHVQQPFCSHVWQSQSQAAAYSAFIGSAA